MAVIGASVGRNGVNNSQDVRTVQTLLNQNIAKLTPLLPMMVSGKCDATTILMIEEYQRRVMQLSQPDGHIDPNGRTIASLTALISAATNEPMLDGVRLPPPAEKVLKEILNAAGISRARVTSGPRTPAEQARVMYENCALKGAEFNKNLYGVAGDKIIDVYVANKDKPSPIVIQLMLDKINQVGPAEVSKHVSDTHYAFDVAPSSIPLAKQAAFIAAIKANSAVSKLIAPPTDPAFHIEIPKNALNRASATS